MQANCGCLPCMNIIVWSSSNKLVILGIVVSRRNHNKALVRQTVNKQWTFLICISLTIHFEDFLAFILITVWPEDWPSKRSLYNSCDGTTHCWLLDFSQSFKNSVVCAVNHLKCTSTLPNRSSSVARRLFNINLFYWILPNLNLEVF